MLLKTQTIYLEETEESIQNREEAKQLAEDLGIKNTIIHDPVYNVISENIKVDLRLVVSITTDIIIMDKKEYRLPRISLINGEIHTLNESEESIHKLILSAKGMEDFYETTLPRPIP